MIRADRFGLYVEGRQDRAAVNHSPGGSVLVVADGAGGTGGGLEAATALEVLVSGAGFHGDAGAWTRLLRDFDRNGGFGETTAVVAAIADDGTIVGASCGDSEAHWVSNLGDVALTEGQRRKPLLRSGNAVVTPFTLSAAGGVLVIASDGLWKCAQRAVIRELAVGSPISDAEALARRLADAARLPGGRLQDDIAMVIAVVA